MQDLLTQHHFKKLHEQKKGERHHLKGKVAQVGVKTHYSVNKKLSQFDSFRYLWNFDILWWMFGKHFVNKIFN
jgi:hypothetical protein